MVGEQLLALMEGQLLEQEQREFVVERPYSRLVCGDRGVQSLTLEVFLGVCGRERRLVNWIWNWMEFFEEGNRKKGERGM